jgi:hypothetical protein
LIKRADLRFGERRSQADHRIVFPDIPDEFKNGGIVPPVDLHLVKELIGYINHGR